MMPVITIPFIAIYSDAASSMPLLFVLGSFVLYFGVMLHQHKRYILNVILIGAMIAGIGAYSYQAQFAAWKVQALDRNSQTNTHAAASQNMVFFFV